MNTEATNKVTIVNETSRTGSNMGRRRVVSRREKQSTIMSTVTAMSTRKSERKSNLPGPGQYDFKAQFPNGPKFIIQKKTKFDSLFNTKISQNISPGPGAYRISHPKGGTFQSIGIKFKIPQNTSTSEVTGPGNYEITNKFFKREPTAVFGYSKRSINILKGVDGPTAQTYGGHQLMTKMRWISKERNAPRAIIGNEVKIPGKDSRNPAPNSYNTLKSSVGDNYSVKVNFPKAVRPISAKPG